jgi:hypothetical protein
MRDDFNNMNEVEVLKQDLTEKIYWILIEEGQRNLEKPLGSIITNTPDEVRDIIKKLNSCKFSAKGMS